MENYGDGFAQIVDFASTGGAFVVNNSWGFDWRPRVIEIELPGDQKGYFLQPRVVRRGYQSFTGAMLGDRLTAAINNAQSRSSDGMMFVFAAGNDGWNSDTGEVEIFSQKFEGEDIHKYLNEEERDAPTFLPANAPQIARTGTPANLPWEINS